MPDCSVLCHVPRAAASRARTKKARAAKEAVCNDDAIPASVRLAASIDVARSLHRLGDLAWRCGDARTAIARYAAAIDAKRAAWRALAAVADDLLFTRGMCGSCHRRSRREVAASRRSPTKGGGDGERKPSPSAPAPKTADAPWSASSEARAARRSLADTLQCIAVVRFEQCGAGGSRHAIIGEAAALACAEAELDEVRCAAVARFFTVSLRLATVVARRLNSRRDCTTAQFPR